MPPKTWLPIVLTALAAGSSWADDGIASLVRLRVVSHDGATRFGSGVVIAPERVATVCHVTRGAATIEIFHGSTRSIGQAVSGSPLHDVCVVRAPIADVPIARSRASNTLRRGERVVAAGFEGGRSGAAVRAGVVAALYDYDGGSVIRTSAAFDFGSSGGGLFDDAGNLVGLLAFRARNGDNLRFALPSEWLSSDGAVAEAFADATAASSRAFWERPHADRPAFLGVAMRDAQSERR